LKTADFKSAVSHEESSGKNGLKSGKIIFRMSDLLYPQMGIELKKIGGKIVFPGKNFCMSYHRNYTGNLVIPCIYNFIYLFVFFIHLFIYNFGRLTNNMNKLTAVNS